MIKIKIRLLALFLVFGFCSHSQTFLCDASSYIVTGSNAAPIETQLFRIDRSVDPYQFVAIGNPTTVAGGYPNNFSINGLAFNPVDNFLYAVVIVSDGNVADPTHFVSKDLVRIDNTGLVTKLGNVPGLTSINSSGTFLRDGTYVVGGGNGVLGNSLISTVNVSTLVSTPIVSFVGVIFRDISVNPQDTTVDRIYFIDENNPDTVRWGRPSDGVIEGSATNPIGINVNTGTQFFDSFGNLYLRSNSDDNLYKIDMDSSSPTFGVATLLTSAPAGDVHDGASCAFDVAIEKTVSSTTVVGGNAITYTYRISNPTDNVVSGLDFIDDLDDARTFVSASLTGEGALGGTVNAYDDTNLLSITGFSAPANSITTLTVQVNIPAYFTGIVVNQAQINGLPVVLGTSVVTDEPDTPIYGDSTTITVTPGDSDGDGVDDLNDIDNDNDGIPDIIEGDGVNDPLADGDGDGWPFYLDDDDAVAGVGNDNGVIELGFDTDGDLVPNHLDLDSDNDGISDIVEAGGTDANGDGQVDAFTDVGPMDGLDDTIAGSPLPLPNTDGTFGPDYLDIDSDDDGIPDNVEAQTTATYLAPSGNDNDGDGLDDNYDGDDGGAAIVPENTDSASGDLLPDYLDTDSDADGVLDATENGVAVNVALGTDADGDGLDDAWDDVDGTGNIGTPANVNDGLDVPDLVTNLGDEDGDGEVDYRDILDNDNDGVADNADLDDDNDGILDTDENGGVDPFIDTDLDGIPNYLDSDSAGFTDVNSDGVDDAFDHDGDGVINQFDLDSDNDGISDIVEAGGTDANGDGQVDGFTDVGPMDGLDDTIAGSPLPLTNTDGTFGPDYLDIDSDDDGIPDNVEAQTTATYLAPSGNDNDGDGLDDNYDGDDGGTAIVPENTDSASGDLLPDYLDTDSDADGVLDATENGVAVNVALGTDADGDGLDDAWDDVDGTGNIGVAANVNDGLDVPDLVTNLGDEDGDGEVDYRDILDNDNDGVADNADLDDDNDGILDTDENGGVDPFIDTDLDGIPNYLDSDSAGFTDVNSDGVDDAFDHDGDGVIDQFDLDSDNDGISDIVEAGGTDANGDGQVDGFTDVGPMDGLDDTIAGSPLLPPNTDSATGDLLPNYLDLDSDGDGISDIIEAGSADGDGDGQVDGFTDVNLDGLDDTIVGSPLLLPNTDSDALGLEDYIDIDADGDGIVDNIESQTTSGYVAPAGTDIDNDGLDDNYDGDDGTTIGVIDPLGPLGAIEPTNTDGFDNPDYLDTDSDNDGDLDSLEGWDTDNDGTAEITPAGGDADGDGLDNAYDIDDSALDPTNGGTLPTDFPNLDVTPLDTDRDWRESPDNDSDNDGVDDGADLDDDNDGIPDVDESGGNEPDGDADGDGIPNWQDVLDGGGAGDGSFTNYDDLDGDGIPDVYDTDGDGVPNHLDLDSDNDGIYDLVESGQLSIANVFDNVSDGIIDGSLTNSGTNGLFSFIESDDSATATLLQPTANSDAAGDFDAYVLDADDDGCNDLEEAGFVAEDTEPNGVLGSDVSLIFDVNGLVDLTASGLTLGYTDPNDNDGNLILDFQEASVTTAVTTQPSAITPILAGTTVTIVDLVTTGDTYQWQVSPTGLVGSFTDILLTDTDYSGSQTDELTINNTPAGLGGNFYQVLVSTSNYACDTEISSDAVQLIILGDSDGDTIADGIDLDDDNDGIPDTVESGGNDPNGDADGDGVPNWQDVLDGGGVGDGSLTNYDDLDSDGIPDVYDTDGDGVPNHLDLDSDNDGIYDIVESGQLNGTDVVDDGPSDGRIDGADDTTVGANGLFDLIETGDTFTDTVTQDTADSDGDLIPDSNELNADGDTFNGDDCNDVTEAGFGAEDTDNNGVLGNDAGLTVDANGVVNTPGLTLGYTEPTDFGGDGTYDFQVAGIGVQPIITQPSDDTIVINAGTVFTVDGQPVTFQWQERVNSTSPWINVNDGAPVINVTPGYSGATTNELTLTMVPAVYNGYQYRVILSSPAFACDVDIPSFPAATLTVQSDFDGDGVGDASDLDSDNDGIPNTDEYPDIIDPALNNPYGDPDGDGTPNYLDPQPNNVSVVGDGSTVNPDYDFDGDGIANHLDTDADGDGLFDAVEAGHGFVNIDVNGFIIGANTGSGANGLFDAVEDNDTASAVINYPITDTDGDLNFDFLDIDDDGDDVDTIVETAFGDTDGDGFDNYLDIDDDNDGILTATEGGTRNDDSATGDLLPNYLDLDSDGDGITDNVEGQSTMSYIEPEGLDDDNDGLDNAYESTNGIQPVNTDLTFSSTDLIPDYLDTDSDNDSIPDSIEGHDNDDDGEPDVTPTGDTDTDGLDDAYDGSIGDYADPNGLIITTNPETDLRNTDGTEDVNFRDEDDDGDGVFTIYEDGLTSDALVDVDTDLDGIPNYLDNDDDGDGVPTADENPDTSDPLDGNPDDAQDLDEDGTPDYLDNDDDNDGIPTLEEIAFGDSDGDGIDNYLDIDDDNDGILTIVEGDNNEDGDTYANGDPIPNYLDQDADGDGIPDNVEGQVTGDGYAIATAIDSDNDGLDDAYDDSDGYPDSLGIDPEDTDSDGDSDFIDGDSDNDNVPDSVEGHDYSDLSNPIGSPDGEPDVLPLNVDSDEDGLDDAYDGSIGDFEDPNGLFVDVSPTELPNRDQALFEIYGSNDNFSPITPDAQVDYRDTDDDGDGSLTSSPEEDRDNDGNPRNDNCNGPPDNLTPNYLDPISCDRVPAGFSPNGDNNNEVFIIPALDQYPNFSMEIYDRWGNSVYNYNNNGRVANEIEWWDGFSTGSITIKKGQKVPVGTYFYIINFNGSDRRSPISGWVYVNY